MRSLYAAEAAVEAAILDGGGRGPFGGWWTWAPAPGRMLTLLGTRAQTAIGLDLSRQMLNIARGHVAEAGLAACELRHGDILATRPADGCADLVVVHQVLHYLADPAAAVAEAARLVAPGGRLLIVDFAPHDLEFLRAEHRHRRLGFSDAEIDRWLSARRPVGDRDPRPAAGRGGRPDRQDLERDPSGRASEADRMTIATPFPSRPAGALGPSPAPASGPATAQDLLRVLAAEDAGGRGEPVGRHPPAGAAGSRLRLGHLRRRRLDPRAHPPHRAADAERDHPEARRPPDLRRRLAATRWTR